MADGQVRPLVIKKVKKVSGGGHHGGAWKVAYADFVTAMMAFFMLLWLLNVADTETLQGLAEFFTPSAATVPGSSGSGQLLGGQAAISEGALTSGSAVLEIPSPPPTTATLGDRVGKSDGDNDGNGPLKSKIPEATEQETSKLAQQIKIAIQKSSELTRNREHLIVDETEDGLRIQIVDRDQRPMFRPGTAELYGFSRNLLLEIGEIMRDLPNRVAMSGHTGLEAGAAPVGDEWALSSDRANTARRVLADAGVTPDRFFEVTGKADTEPLYPDQPRRSENRRIALLILKEAPVVPPSVEERY